MEPEKLEPSIVQAEQIFTIDKSRVQNFVGHLTPEEMSRVDDAVKISLALNPMGSIQKLKPIIRSAAAYAPPEVVDGKPPVYPYTPIKSDFEDAETVEEMMLYTELQSAVHAMIQRLEYSFTFNPSLLTSPKRKKQVAEILTEAEKFATPATENSASRRIAPGRPATLCTFWMRSSTRWFARFSPA